jgi:hypothetical protein
MKSQEFDNLEHILYTDVCVCDGLGILLGPLGALSTVVRRKNTM